MKPTIEASRNITLRAVSPDVAKEKYLAAINTREQLLPWLGWIHFYDSSDTEAGIKIMREYQETKVKEFENGTNYTYDIFFDGAFAGCVEIMHINNTYKSCEIGYWLAKGFTGKGIMTHAVNAITEQAFSKLNMHCVVILAADKNKASRAVAERCGFKLDAILRSRVLLEGEYYDEAVYSKLASD